MLAEMSESRIYDKQVKECELLFIWCYFSNIHACSTAVLLYTDYWTCRRISIIDRRRGPSSLGLPEGVKESIVKVGILHGNYSASDLATVARSYVLL